MADSEVYLRCEYASIDLAGEVAEALNEGVSYQEVMTVSYKQEKV